MRFLILILLSILVIPSSPINANAQETGIEREQDLDKTLTLTLYGNRYIVATYVLPDTNFSWHQIHPYVPSEVLKLDNPTLTPEELKVRLYRMKKVTMNEYTFIMDNLTDLIAQTYPQYVAPNLQLQITEFLTSNNAEGLVGLFPELKKEIMDADEINKKVSAFLFLNEIIDYNINLMKIATETQKRIDLEKEQASKDQNKKDAD